MTFLRFLFLIFKYYIPYFLTIREISNKKQQPARRGSRCGPTNGGDSSGQLRGIRANGRRFVARWGTSYS